MSKVKSRNSCPSGINPVPGLSSSRGSVQSKVPESSVTDWIAPPAIETTHVHLQPQFSVDLSSLPEKVDCATYRRGKRQTRASAYLNFNINCGGAAGAWRGHRETSFHADITCLQEVCMCEKERAWFKRHCNMKTYACHGILGCSVPAEINGTGQGERPTGKFGRSVALVFWGTPALQWGHTALK